MSRSKQDETEDHAAALINVSAWFARWVVKYEIGAFGGPNKEGDPMGIAKLPEAFRQLVAMQMVANNPAWSNTEEASKTLHDFYCWGPE
jgi:hypothetical protein